MGKLHFVLSATLMLLPASVLSSEAKVENDGFVGYRLGSGDKLRVIIFGEDALGGTFAVGPVGTIALPLIGEVKASGTTSTELQDKIAAELRKGFLKAPRVSVEILNYRPFYILGEVNQPGEYPYSSGLTVTSAVARARGFTYRANTHEIQLQRAGDDQARKVRVTPTTLITPGDTIVVRERWF